MKIRTFLRMFGANKESVTLCIKHINDKAMFTNDSTCLYATPFARVQSIYLDTLFADADHDFTAQVQMPEDPNLKYDKSKYSTESMTTRRANKAKNDEDEQKRREEEIKRKEEIKIMMRFSVDGAVQDFEEQVRTKECVSIWLDLITKVENNIKAEEEKKRKKQEQEEKLKKEKELEEFNKKNINPSNSKFQLNAPEKPKPKKTAKKKKQDDLFDF